MTAQFSEEILNKFLAPNIYSFDSADIPDLTAHHNQSSHWMGNHFLNAIVHGTFLPPSRQFTINALYRAQTTFTYYHLARNQTLDCLNHSSIGSPSVRRYFGALAQWEICFLNLAVLADLVSQWGQPKLFTKNDGSETQRAYDISNKIKHHASHIRSSGGLDNLTVPMWLENDGFHSVGLSLSYSELAMLVDDAATLADDIQNPTAFVAEDK